MAESASAQSSGGTAPQTLGQRLQQFRQDLLGGDPEPDPTVVTRAPTPARPGQKVAMPQNSNRATYPPGRPTAPPVAQSTLDDDMPLPPSGALAGDKMPQSRLTTGSMGSSRATKPAAGVDDEFSGDAGSRASARRGGEASLSSRLGSALSPISVDAARRPARVADSRLVEREGGATADRVVDSAAPSAGPAAPKHEMKAETKVDLAPRSGSHGPAADDGAPTANRSLEGVLTVGQNAALVVETIGPKSVTVGKEAVFSVKVRNAGENAAADVTVSIAIPSHVDVLSTQPTGGAVQTPGVAEDTTTLQWQINRLDPRSKESLTLRLVPRRSLPIELAVQWTVAPDSLQTLVEVQEPKLSMSLSGPNEILYGQSKIYKIIIANPGNGDAENVVVNLLPIGHGSEGGASRRMGTLRPGQSKTIEVELTARQSGMLNIKAEASADGGLAARAEEEVVVRRASLKAAVQAPRVKFAGTSAVYTILVGNAGNATAENVVVTAALPPQAKFVSSSSGGKADPAQGKVVWNVGSLPSGSERALEVHCVLQAAGENRVQVSASASDDQTASAIGSTRVDAVADLKLEIRDPQGPVAVGEDAVYEVLVRNRGSKSAEGVDLVAFFTEGLEAVRAHGAAHEIGRGQVVFRTVPSLAPGAELAIKIHARAEIAGNHVFRAEVACQSPQLKLSAEETTLFYGDEGGSAAGGPATGRDASPAPLRAVEP